MYDNYQETAYEYDECLSKGICSVSPALSSVHEIILLYIKELAFYLVRLKKFGITNKTINDTIIYSLSNIITNAEYNQEQFHDLISKLYDYIFQSKAIYEKYCAENDITPEMTKSYFKYSKKFSLTDAIRKGEKYFLKKSSNLSQKQKNLYDIMFFLLKSITIKITELVRFHKDADEAFFAVLTMLDTIKGIETTEAQIELAIRRAIKDYYNASNAILEAQKERYGKISPAEVSFSTEPGKAILVSGSDMTKLEDVLKAVEHTNISVYTHGTEMFMAHAFEKLRSHPNLKGHFGSGLESSIVDFASFPGAILMTKFTIQRVEYLFRGRLFTLDPIPPFGVIKIKDDFYEPLVKSALEAKGFSHGLKKPSMKVGFIEKEIDEKITSIMSKIEKGEINNLYIVGLINYPNLYTKYFERFFDLLPKDSYAISLNYDLNRKNVYHPNSFYDYSLIYKIINDINLKKPLGELNLTVFLTKCDKHTIANLLYLKEAGVKHVYSCKCPPSLINPALVETLNETFDIKEFSDPKKDIEDTLK